MTARRSPTAVAAAPAPLPYVYVGIRGSIVALKRDSGEIAWSTPLAKGASLVPLVVEGGLVIGISGGEVSAIDARTGKLVWHNVLKGYGTGFAVLAGSQDPGGAAAIAAASAAAHAAMIASTAAASS
jgi:glucose dehydrogenase